MLQSSTVDYAKGFITLHFTISQMSANFTDGIWLHVSMYVLLFSVFYILHYYIYAAKNNNILCIWQVQH